VCHGAIEKGLMLMFLTFKISFDAENAAISVSGTILAKFPILGHF
jgi:hypothetical protein